MIETEITNQEKVKSDYVVNFRKAIELPSRFYIFIEYCNGGDLRELFEAKDWKIPHRVIQKIMR